MTTKQDLIAQLRAMGMPDWAMARVLMTQAADTLEALQAEVKHLNLHLKATQSGRDAALARLAITEEANSMLLARNKWLEHTLEVAGASPAVVTATKPLTYAQAHLLGFTCTKVEDASGKERLTIYKTKLGAHSEHQLYDDEALALWINIGKALGPEYTGASPVQPAQQFTWSDVGRLIGSTDQARAAGLVVGTSNWGAFVCKAMGVRPSQAQPPAPSEAAREYMTGYSDGREWAQADILYTVEPMTAVADRYAHRLALELECVLADRPGYYDKAIKVLSEYRSAMNAIHEHHSPTFMGEPLIAQEPKP